MIQKVVTGGQTGAEQAAWTAARRAGIATGGYMPRGFLTDDGPAPRLGALHRAVEFPFDESRRIRANLRRADGLLWFGSPDSPEGRDTLAACRELAKPFLTVRPRSARPSEIVNWLSIFEIAVLVIAGNRASEVPDIGPRVEAILDRTFALLRDSPFRGA